MKTKLKLSGVWSAAPTPFTETMKIDSVSVKRMINHHIRLGVKGLFIGGTSGEGLLMPRSQFLKLMEMVAKDAKGKLTISVQVTDNSAARILENMKAAKNSGADIAVIAPPLYQSDVYPKLEDTYMGAIENSPLPVGIYDRGKHSSIVVPDSVLKKAYMHPKVILIKDSSADKTHIKLALAARKKNPNLSILTGWEFNCVEYLQAGYDGLLLGGGVFNGYIAGKIIEAYEKGDIKLANKLQTMMNEIMWDVFGGKDVRCWLSGQKRILVELGIFRTGKSYANYPLTQTCIKDIKRIVRDYKNWLLPEESKA